MFSCLKRLHCPWAWRLRVAWWPSWLSETQQSQPRRLRHSPHMRTTSLACWFKFESLKEREPWPRTTACLASSTWTVKVNNIVESLQRERTPADKLSHAEATYNLSLACFSNKSNEVQELLFLETGASLLKSPTVESRFKMNAIDGAIVEALGVCPCRLKTRPMIMRGSQFSLPRADSTDHVPTSGCELCWSSSDKGRKRNCKLWREVWSKLQLHDRFLSHPHIFVQG